MSGYLINDKERDLILNNSTSIALIINYSKAKNSYDDRSKKIAMLLIQSDVIENVEFEISAKRFFEELGRITYKKDEIDIKIQDMKAFGKKVLLEQAIVAIVSNWESYFTNIFGIIMDDDEFIKRILSQKEEFSKFLKDFKLFLDFQQILILNKNIFNGLQFGTYITKNKRINFQDLKAIKKMMKLLLDINIVNISDNWNEIDKFFEARHILIHSSTDLIENNLKFRQENNIGIKTISAVYTKQKIEDIMKDMMKIIDTIEMKLFFKYDLSNLE